MVETHTTKPYVQTDVNVKGKNKRCLLCSSDIVHNKHMSPKILCFVMAFLRSKPSI